MLLYWKNEAAKRSVSMALRPKDFSSQRQAEFAEIESVIDKAIDDYNGSSPILVWEDALPDYYRRYMDKIQEVYTQTGQESVKLLRDVYCGNYIKLSAQVQYV